MADHPQVVVAEHAAALGELQLGADEAADEGVGEVDESVLVGVSARQERADVGVLRGLAEAADGASAIRLYRQYQPDVVVLDMRLPDASGAEVFGYGFTCEEIDYLDSKAEAEARRQQQKQAKPTEVTTKRTRSSKAPKGPGEYDVPF